MATDVFNRSLTVNQKIKFFFGSWALATFLLFDAVSKFIDNLGAQKVLALPDDFSFLNLAFSDGAVLAGVKVLVLLLSSFGFGIIYSYLARRASLSDRVSLGISNALLYLIAFPVLILLLYSLGSSGQYTPIDLFKMSADLIMQNGQLVFGIIAQFLILILGSLLGFAIGHRLTADLPEEKGRLFGVKWYHYMWLTPALSVYLQSLLILIYLTVKVLLDFLSHFNIFESFSENSKNEYSFQAMMWTLAISYGVGYMIVQLGLYQLSILRKDFVLPRWKKIGISILFSLIIPFVIIAFTIVGNYE